MNELIKPALEDYKQQLIQTYGHRIEKIILYGSYARGDAHIDSDIDLLIILNDEKINRLQEMEKISKISTEILIKYGFIISGFPFAQARLENEKTLFIENVMREGIAI